MGHFSLYSYLGLLAQNLHAALQGLGAEEAARHEASLLRFAGPQGGFRGRRGGADLYYTTFAIRALHALAKISPKVSQETQIFLARQQPATLVDAVNLLELHVLLETVHGDWVSEANKKPQKERGLSLNRGDYDVASCRASHDPAQPLRSGLGHPLNSCLLEQSSFVDFAESFRTADGGYGQARGGGRGSIYNSFLAILSYNLLEKLPPEKEKLGRFVLSRQRPDGGFGEDAPDAHSGANPTAAGMALLILLGVEAPQALETAAVFLQKLQDDSGGWRALDQAPLPDLLSTCASALTLAGLGVLSAEGREQAVAFARSCERPEGGFSAGPYDKSADAEYTYYGLAVLALAKTRGAGLLPTRKEP